jgi:SAM-dependent methyltransferase
VDDAATPRVGTEWFEPLYDAAGGDPSQVPWARLEPSPLLLSWLDQPGLDVSGSDALVVGCGLGDDAAELARRGCRVVAFDLSRTAVDWARERFGDTEVEFLVADLFDLPERLVASAGLVVEVRTVQSLPEPMRADAMRAIAATVAPGGLLVHAGLVATSPRAAKTWEGPPWALSPDELAVYEQAGLERVDLAHPPGVEGDAMEVVVTLQRPLDEAG